MIKTFDTTGTMYEIYNRLCNSSSEPLVYAQRGAGKTTAILHYIANTALNSPKRKPILITSEMNTALIIHRLYSEMFPTLPTLTCVTAFGLDTVIYGQKPGPVNLYLDEFAYFSESDKITLSKYKSYIKAGVSSPKGANIYNVPVESIF